MLPHLGIPELLVILFIIILIFGANRLPDIGRGIGKGIAERLAREHGDQELAAWVTDIARALPGD